MKNRKLLTIAGVTLITASVAFAGYNPGSRSQERQNSIHGNTATVTVHDSNGMGGMHANHQMGNMQANSKSRHMAMQGTYCTTAAKRHQGQATPGNMMGNVDHGSDHHDHMASDKETDNTVMPMHNQDNE